MGGWWRWRLWRQRFQRTDERSSKKSLNYIVSVYLLHTYTFVCKYMPEWMCWKVIAPRKIAGTDVAGPVAKIEVKTERLKRQSRRSIFCNGSPRAPPPVSPLHTRTLRIGLARQCRESEHDALIQKESWPNQSGWTLSNHTIRKEQTKYKCYEQQSHCRASHSWVRVGGCLSLRAFGTEWSPSRFKR